MLEKDIQLLMDATPQEGARIGKLNAGVTGQRTKTTHAGQMLYVSAYPLWDTKTAQRARGAVEMIKQEPRSSEAQRKLNARNAQRKLEQLINANFGAGDILVTCTYQPGCQPDTDERAHRDMANLITRLRRMYKKQGIDAPRYVYVTETTESSKNGKRYHHHMIIEKGVSRDDVETAWGKVHGGICNARRAQQLPEGLTGFAKYITKQVHGDDRQKIATRRRWCASKNLVQPITTTADKKISRKRVERIAQDCEREPEKARAALEKVYPGYRVLEMTVRTSSYVGGAYVYALLTREERSSNGTKGRSARNQDWRHPHSDTATIGLAHG